jgi:secreted protein with Ig-like and vWFA domain
MNPSPEQLTAYALGEGTPAEREALAAYLATHAEAAAEVAAISDVAALVSSELSQEAGAPGLDPERRAALAALSPIPAQRLIPPKRLTLPIMHYILWPGLLAAGLAAVVMPAMNMTRSGSTDTRYLGPLDKISSTVAGAAVRNTEAAPVVSAQTSKSVEAVKGFAPGGPSVGIAPPTSEMEAVEGFAPGEPIVAIAPAILGMSEGAVPGGAGVRGFAPGELIFGIAPPILGMSEGAEPVAAGEAYPTFAADGWHRVSAASDDGNRWSTLGADVDTASYANVRRFLYSGQLPPSDAVRTEELLNSFDYDYQPPRGRSTPFAVLPEVGPAPWASDHQLVRIALKGYELDRASRPPANLVFLVDVSGSMNQPTKLPLVQRALTLLTQQLRQDDRVAIVTYAGAAGVRLQPTSVENRERIQAAIDGLSAGGGTNGAGGIRIAYDLAKRDFIRGGVNRVVLCTDGDFNVGVSSREELEGLITEQARSNVFLTALGFGMGNYHDSTLQVLADKGNGHYAYIDSEAEARKQIVEGGTGMLVTIAKDVKLQVEFNPSRVGAWRLLGYEKRHLEHQDFSDDQKDGGEIGAGHSMTALYEIIPVTRDVGLPTPRYAAEGVARSRAEAPAAAVSGGELLTVSLRWKLPEGATSTAIAIPVSAHGGQASNDFRFATAVAEFAQSLRGVEGPWSLERALSTAQATAGEDPGRREFIDLIRKAQQLQR